jgi:saccharopine dehydrogenase (NADP+, L-glutamate forming)
MSKILILGAGKSSTALIEYMLGEATEHGWHVRVADLDVDLVRDKLSDHPHGEAVELDAENESQRDQLIEAADLVISMLPAAMHPPVAEACVELGKHMVTASYVSPEVRGLAEAAERAGVVLLNEMGVDPGIDHMSAMQRLDALRRQGAQIRDFETFTGGLVAPDSDDNPWHYKFTWNPRNVVLAGQGGVKFKHNGRYKYVPYHKLFSRHESISIPGWGEFEGYPNRDSLKYRHHYGLRGIDTIYRGTLRRPGFCDAWHCLVQIGITDDSYEIEKLGQMTYRDFVNSYLWYDKDKSVELKLLAYLGLPFNSPVFARLEWLGLFEAEPIGMSHGTPAQVLQRKLEEKWALAPNDRDMICMLHKVVYEQQGALWREQSSMVTLGSDPTRTAMARTVGLPTGIGAKLILDGTIHAPGVHIPTRSEVYEPVLAELRVHGIGFETVREKIE